MAPSAIREPLSFLYARQSADDIEKQMHSVKRQIAELKEHHQATNGLPPLSPDVFLDYSVSGKQRFEERKAGKHCMDTLRTGDALLIQHPDRLSRRYWASHGAVDQLLNVRKVAVHILVPMFGALKLETPEGQIMFSCMCLGAQMEHTACSTRILATQKYLGSLGRATCSSRVGEKNILIRGSNGERKLFAVPDQKKIPQLDQICMWRKHCTLKETAKRANDLGWTTGRGATWSVANVHKVEQTYDKQRIMRDYGKIKKEVEAGTPYRDDDRKDAR